jgi:hypothetical protein
LGTACCFYPTLHSGGAASSERVLAKGASAWMDKEPASVTSPNHVVHV